MWGRAANCHMMLRMIREMKVFNDWFGCFIDIYVITQLIVLYYPGVCLTCTSVSLSVKGTDTAVMSNQILTRPF